MSDQIFIKNLHVKGVIGINDWERELKQDILINVVIDTDITAVAQADTIDQAVNYRSISKDIIQHVEDSQQKPPFTVEKLAEDLAQLCLQAPHAKAVRIRVEKPGAVRFADSVGVEIYRKA